MSETSSALAAGQAAWLQQRAACLARLANQPPMPSVEVTGHPAAKERAKALGAWREVMRLGELLLGEAVQQLDKLTCDPSDLTGRSAARLPALQGLGYEAALSRWKRHAARGATVEVKITGYGDPVAWAGLVEQEENAWSEEDFKHTLQHFAKGVLTLLKRSSLHFSDLDVAQKTYVTYELAGDLLDLTQMPE